MKLIKFFVPALIAAGITISCNSQKAGGNKEVKLNTASDSVSYAIGVLFGNQLASQDVKDIDPEILSNVIAKVLNEQETQMDPQTASQFLNTYFTAQQEKQFEDNLKEGQAFLDANKAKEGIVVTESGIQYEVLEEGTGPKPEEGDQVSVHYHGTTIEGEVFDSSVERGEPFTFQVGGQVIEGWNQIIKMMPVGSKYKVYIPTELAYGTRVRPGGPIEPNVPLIFEIELLEILENSGE